ncbi:MAG: hypothetical protein NVS4B5_04670 [Vulcanimicrobiaceae bacterium]
MQFKDQTSSYVDLSTQTYSLFVDAMSSSNKRALEYTKSLWEISSRPYASTAVETTVRENFDRANQIISLTVSELQTGGQKNAEFAEKLVAHSAKIQESLVAAMKGLVQSSISNLTFAKDSASQQFDNGIKRVEETASRASASAN